MFISVEERLINGCINEISGWWATFNILRLSNIFSLETVSVNTLGDSGSSLVCGLVNEKVKWRVHVYIEETILTDHFKH